MRKNFLLALFAGFLCAFLTASLPAEAAKDTRREKIDHVELVLVIDKSGSMSGLESDTIGGFNSMIEKEKKLDATVNVTAVLFNDSTDLLYDRRDIRRIRPMTEEQYETGGTTALLDAVGSTILKMDKVEDINRRGTKVIFVIITDGLENASEEFTTPKVKKLISDRQEKCGWDFIYLGANIDAAEEAEAIGVDKKQAVTYRNTPEGVRANYDAISEYTKEAVDGSTGEDGSWKDYVEKDETN